MDIKDLIRRLRSVANKSEFAKRSGVSRATLYRLIDGLEINPTMRLLERIEKQLDSEERK